MFFNIAKPTWAGGRIHVAELLLVGYLPLLDLLLQLGILPIFLHHLQQLLLDFETCRLGPLGGRRISLFIAFAPAVATLVGETERLADLVVLQMLV